MSKPKTVTRELFIHHSSYREDNIWVCSDDMSDHGDILLGKVSVTFEIPQRDIAAAKVEMLEKQIEKLQAKTQIKVTNMKEQIQSLLAIGHCV
jgi:hypothetical protein